MRFLFQSLRTVSNILKPPNTSSIGMVSRVRAILAPPPARVLCRQPRIFLQAAEMSVAGNRDNPWFLAEHPCQRDLPMAWRDAHPQDA